ncbi:MAG: hypothetical protein LBB07_02760, partial [Bifidobacteriaceae bacterium]|nr:hypothetical protein [Bifidobacteriaceae bacterium]
MVIKMKKQMKNQKSEKEMKINLKGTQMKLSSLIEWLSRKTIVAACGFALLVAGLSVAPALVIADPPDPLDTGNDFKVADVSFKLPVKGWEKSDGISDYFTQGTGLQFLSAQNVEQSAEVSVVVYPESDSFTLDAGIPEDAKPSINDTKDGVLYKIWNLDCKNGENCDSTVAKAAKDVDGKRAVWTVIKNNEDPENDIKIDQAYMDKFIESISGDSQVAPKENKAESKPSPTPSATSEPSPTPSVEPSATPEPSASPSTSPEAKASPSPSPSPSATSAAEEPKTDVAEENAETKSSLLKDFDSKTGNFSFAKPPQSGQELLLLFTKLQMEFSNDIKKTYIDASTTEETSKDTFLQSAAKAISDVVEEKAGEFDKEYKNLIPGNSEFKLPELQKAIEKQGAENSNKYTFEYLFGDAQTFLSKDANPIKERVGLDEIANRLSELVDKGEANKLSTEVLKHGIDGSSVVNSINELKNVLSDLYVNHSDKNDANVRGVVKALAENKNVPNISEISEKFASAYSSADPITGEGGNTAYFEKLINVLTKSNVLSVGSEKTKLDIYEACELAAALNSDYNSATFELRKKFNELFTQSIEFSTSSLAQAMSYDLIKQEANKGVLGESLASITSLLSTNLDQEDAKNLEISVERIRSGIETQREIKAKTQSNLNKLIQNDIELDRKYADSETKLRIEEGRFYDEAKPSVYNYSLDKWFVPYVFNSMAYHGVDDSIPVGVREIFYQTDAKLDSAAQENPLTRSSVYSSEKNPYI